MSESNAGAIMGPTATRAETFWRGHVEAWRADGISRREYCARHALSRKTFDWWAWRLGPERQPGAASAAPHFLPLVVAEVTDVDAVAPSAAGARVAAAAPEPGDARIEIALPDGVLVRVGIGFEAAALRRVLTVLGR